MASSSDSVRYVALCTALGLVLGWLPGLVHGPIPEKWSIHGVDGDLVVWCYVAGRLSIGLWVGLTSLPEAWYLRGPLCGALAMLPIAMLGLSNQYCGAPCMFWNMVTGATVGLAVGALAWSLTGRHHAPKRAEEGRS